MIDNPEAKEVLSNTEPTELTKADAAKAVGCDESEVLNFRLYPDGHINVVTIDGRLLTDKEK